MNFRQTFIFIHIFLCSVFVSGQLFSSLHLEVGHSFLFLFKPCTGSHFILEAHFCVFDFGTDVVFHEKTFLFYTFFYLKKFWEPFSIPSFDPKMV